VNCTIVELNTEDRSNDSEMLLHLIVLLLLAYYLNVSCSINQMTSDS